MNILVIGSGGREHALTWKLNSSPQGPTLFCAPGNPGISQIAECKRVDPASVTALADLAEELQADLTVVGPEAPLVAGVADLFATRGLRLVGPTAAAARLEGSKIFAKEFMSRHRIPTARFVVCDSPQAARDAFRQFDLPLVVKADGLAAGKGVRIPRTELEFDQAIEAMMVDKVFGAAGDRILLEECLIGREASLMLFTDGTGYRAIVPAQDYKRVFDRDQGPNTGGMGSFSTPGLIDEPMHDRICRDIVEPTIEGMRSEGDPFSGILYCGLMLTEAGPQVIEFNCRFGDPETQAVLMRLDDDLVDICDAIVERRIETRPINWSNDSSVCIVAASGGYPGDFEKGKEISGLDYASKREGVVIFHAGTSIDANGALVTSGGRVLGVTARAATLEQARTCAYDAMSLISFKGFNFRTDIGR